MRRLVAVLSFTTFCVAAAGGQVRQTSVPLADTLMKALNKTLLTTPGSQPFHLRISISEPENPQSAYQASLEEWWVSSEQWRREVTDKEGLKQTIVVNNGSKTEEDGGDYFSLWLRSFVAAAFEPVPNVDAWNASGRRIEQTIMPNGARTDACVRSEGKIGDGDNATNSYTNLCFDGDGKLKFYGSPRYSMEFSNYHGFGKKEYPRTFTDDPEPGTKLVGQVVVLEEESKAHVAADIFTPLPQNDHRFETIPVGTATLTKLGSQNSPIVWPTVRSGNIHGHLALYVSVDATGRVREAWPLNSDNAGLNDAAREQVRQWQMKLAKDAGGNAVQVDGGLSFTFDTTIGDPLPQLSDAEVRSLAIRTTEPQWPTGSVKSGQVVEVQISINEEGILTGSSFGQNASDAQFSAYVALQQWTFRPLIRDGKPQYFHGTVRFVVP